MFSSSIALADGPPIDKDGNITIPYFTVRLTQAQKDELQYSRLIQLTKAQMKIVRNIWTYDLIDVLDPNYHDCTCGMYYAIWINPDEIAFLGDSNVVENNTDEFFEERYSLSSNDYKVDNSNEFYIGTEGKVYHENVWLKKYLWEIVFDEILEKEKDDQYLVIYVAPTQGNPNSAQIEETRELLKSKIPDEIHIVWM